MKHLCFPVLLLCGCLPFEEELARWDEAHDAGSVVCRPGDEPLFCYSADAATLANGACRGGLRYCDDAGTAWGACQGEITPGMEGCQ